jgi:ATP-dependent exoDNAse (exonuclease V) beta subunit
MRLTSTVAEVMALFSDDRFAEVFSTEARAEVSIAAMIDPPDAERFGFSGQIDRLLVTDSRVLVVDFKTNRPPPGASKMCRAEYLRQLAAYAHVLREIFPAGNRMCPVVDRCAGTHGRSAIHAGCRLGRSGVHKRMSAIMTRLTARWSVPTCWGNG